MIHCQEARDYAWALLFLITRATEGWRMVSGHNGRNVLWRSSHLQQPDVAFHQHEVSLAFKDKHGIDWVALASHPKDPPMRMNRRWMPFTAACSAWQCLWAGSKGNREQVWAHVVWEVERQLESITGVSSMLRSCSCLCMCWQVFPTRGFSVPRTPSRW